MSKLFGGDTAPRDGFIEYLSGWQVVPGVGENATRGAEVKAGDKLPGPASLEYAPGPLRPGETVPRNGVWFNNLSGESVALEAGDKFPAGDAASDWSWVRK